MFSKIIGSFSNKKNKSFLPGFTENRQDHSLKKKIHLALRNMFNVCRALTPSAYGGDF